MRLEQTIRNETTRLLDNRLFCHDNNSKLKPNLEHETCNMKHFQAAQNKKLKKEYNR